MGIEFNATIDPPVDAPETPVCTEVPDVQEPVSCCPVPDKHDTLSVILIGIGVAYLIGVLTGARISNFSVSE